jgi:endonuclease/exonuclease/phosphatase family metal-dependent hydrolase
LSELVWLHGLTGSGENCLNCLIASVGAGIDDTVRACSIPGHGLTHAYGGQNGQLLVSRFPLKDKESILLPSSIANRVGLFATIELAGHESIEVACMHAATMNEVPPSHHGEDGKRMFSGWHDEMEAQIDIVSKRLKERAGGRPQLLMGDLNTGPELKHGITAAESHVWSHILSLGFSSPAAEADDPFCSVCDDNSQRLIEQDHPGNSLIDHVLVRDPPGGSTLTPVCTRRMFDTEHEIYYRGYDGQLVEGHLSDHYAVSVSFRYE